ncbi:hypothetical protein FNV43_RR04352 [Rhamnella rubrinervis]|uniref:beta-ketoacyl-[acyl-carrier-protein] synthase I n=1 Tax=Rhamnella rubrinervis TaxID=2594499 RepID=A0A8K0HK24_9ROSA|nr:hypothetical protein FNV43_RR04352 [Rhamnella rubrinervis]
MALHLYILKEWLLLVRPVCDYVVLLCVFVPYGTNLGDFNEDLWLNSKEHKSIARFIGYALCAADEALKDGKWLPTDREKKKRTGVSIDRGSGSISDILNAAQMTCEKILLIIT